MTLMSYHEIKFHSQTSSLMYIVSALSCIMIWNQFSGNLKWMAVKRFFFEKKINYRLYDWFVFWCGSPRSMLNKDMPECAFNELTDLIVTVVFY